MAELRYKPNVINVLQGECKISESADQPLTTVLGSCVAVCLFDAERKIGGMNHFLLPNGKTDAGECNRYGVNAMEQVINELLKAGARKDRLQAKAFGGARMTTGLSNIGAANAQFATDFLAREGVPCLQTEFGGDQARRIYFAPTTGQVECHQVSRTAAPPDTSPPTAANPADITLF